MTKNFTAIIILNQNRKNDILECLRSLFRMDYKEFEIIVVDNGSTDGSSEEIEKAFPDIHLIKNKINSGVAGGRNLGINYADNKLNYTSILFLDNDVVVEKKILSELIKSSEADKNAGIITPKCYDMNSPGIIGYAGGMSVNFYTGTIKDIGGGEKDEGQFEEPEYVTSSGGIFLVRKEVIELVGIFDEKFNPYGWEDVDFSIRAGKKGFKILYSPKAIVYHKGGKKGKREPAREYEFSKVKNYFYLIRKHANVIQMFTIFPLFPFRAVSVFAKELIQGEFKIFALKVKGFLSLLKR